jgi:Cu(I)/Ag(I) efflux system membrane protein CusA/SilA
VAGFVRQYNVVSIRRLRSYGVPPSRVVDAIRLNRETGGAGRDGRGRPMARPGNCRPPLSRSCRPMARAVLMRDVARIELGPDERRGLSELVNGEGEAVGGIALQRFGQNALDHRQSQGQARDTARGPPGGRGRDRPRPLELIHRAIANLKSPDRGSPVVAAVHRLLLHVRSRAGRHVTLPVGVLMAFIKNIWASLQHHSLAVVAIAIGAMVDAAIASRTPISTSNGWSRAGRAARPSSLRRSRSGRRSSSAC